MTFVGQLGQLGILGLGTRTRNVTEPLSFTGMLFVYG